MNQINIQLHKTEIGEVILGSFHGKLCLLDFVEGKDQRNRSRIESDRC